MPGLPHTPARRRTARIRLAAGVALALALALALGGGGFGVGTTIAGGIAAGVPRARVAIAGLARGRVAARRWGVPPLAVAFPWRRARRVVGARFVAHCVAASRGRIRELGRSERRIHGDGSSLLGDDGSGAKRFGMLGVGGWTARHVFACSDIIVRFSIFGFWGMVECEVYCTL